MDLEPILMKFLEQRKTELQSELKQKENRETKQELLSITSTMQKIKDCGGLCYYCSSLNAVMYHIKKERQLYSLRHHLHTWYRSGVLLDTKITLDGSDESTTYRSLLETQIQHVLLYFKRRESHGISDTNFDQRLFLKDFLEILAKNNNSGEKEVKHIDAKSCVAIAGHIQEKDLIKILSFDVAKNSMIFIRVTQHTFSVRYDDNTKTYRLYEIGFSYGKDRQHTYEAGEMICETVELCAQNIIQHGAKCNVRNSDTVNKRGASLVVVIASFFDDPSKISFHILEQEEPERFLSDLGLHVMAQGAPETLHSLIELAVDKESVGLRKGIACALTTRDRTGVTGLVTMIVHEPKGLRLLIELAVDKDNVGLRKAIAEALPLFAGTATNLHYMVRFAHEDLNSLLQLAANRDNVELRKAIVRALPLQRKNYQTSLHDMVAFAAVNLDYNVLNSLIVLAKEHLELQTAIARSLAVQFNDSTPGSTSFTSLDFMLKCTPRFIKQLTKIMLSKKVKSPLLSVFAQRYITDMLDEKVFPKLTQKEYQYIHSNPDLFRKILHEYSQPDRLTSKNLERLERRYTAAAKTTAVSYLAYTTFWRTPIVTIVQEFESLTSQSASVTIPYKGTAYK